MRITKFTPIKAASQEIKKQTVTQPVRRERISLFQIYLVVAMILFGILSILSHTHPYFAFDLPFTISLQAISQPWFKVLMQSVSLIGRLPVVIFVIPLILSLIYLVGLRWEAVLGAINAIASAGLGVVLKNIVGRTRPDLETVSTYFHNADPSFPSGHVLLYTSFFGYLFFLAYSTIKKGIWRQAILIVLGGLVILVGPSRIYLGEHWASDTLGAYLLGSICLLLTIRVYRWGREQKILA